VEIDLCTRLCFRLPASCTSSLGAKGIPLFFAIPLAYKQHTRFPFDMNVQICQKRTSRGVVLTKTRKITNRVLNVHCSSRILKVHDPSERTEGDSAANYQRSKHATAVAGDPLNPVMLHLVQRRRPPTPPAPRRSEQTRFCSFTLFPLHSPNRFRYLERVE